MDRLSFEVGSKWKASHYINVIFLFLGLILYSKYYVLDVDCVENTFET